MARTSNKVFVLVLLVIGAYVAIRLLGDPPPGPGGEPPTVLERLLPPLPVPEPKVDLSERGPRDENGEADRTRDGDETTPSYAAGLGAVADALLGPLDGGAGASDLAMWKSRAASDPGPAARAALRACRYLDRAADRRRTAATNLARLETRTFNSFNDDAGESEEKKAFFQAQARRQWDEYAASARPQINRALAAVRAAER